MSPDLYESENLVTWRDQSRGQKDKKKMMTSFMDDPLSLFLSQVFILYIIVFAWLIGKSKKKWDIT